MKDIIRRVAKLEAIALMPPRAAPGRPHGKRGWRKSFGATESPIDVRFGNVQRLPKDYQGERHIEVVKELPDQNGQKWVEFAEVPGPKPVLPTPENPTVHRLNVLFVGPYAEDHEKPTPRR